MEDTWNDMKKLGVVPRNASRFNEKWAKVAQEYYMDSLYNSKAVQGAATNTDRITRMLAAYNAGIGNVGEAVEKARANKEEDNWFKYLPKKEETIPYIGKILRNYKEKQPRLIMRKQGGVLYKQ
jgi:membrane-bound lytic murein transglycosylase MltF